MMAALERLTRARVQLLLRKPFFGVLAMGLNLIEHGKKLSADGMNVYYNRKFVDSMADDELLFAIGHILTHKALNHSRRKGPRDKAMWHISADYATNAILSQEGFAVPDDAFYGPQYEDKSAEEIYSLLHPSSSSGKEEHCDGENGGSADYQASLSGKWKHYDEICESDCHDAAAEAEKRKCGSEEELHWKPLISAVYGYAMSESMRKALYGLPPPIVDWKEKLRRLVEYSVRRDCSWHPPNRRYVWKGLYLPSPNPCRPAEMAVIIDSSGSVSDSQLRQFLSEANSILHTFDVSLHIIVCDNNVHSHRIYGRQDTIDIALGGGGGTSFVPAFRLIGKECINPSIVIVLTDGYGEFPEEPSFPTLWCLTGKGIAADNVPFGEVIRMEECV